MTDIPSASQMHRHANCPGNRILIRSLKDRELLKEEELSAEATVGTRIHAALEGMPEKLTLSESEIMSHCNLLADRCLKAIGKPIDREINEERFYYEIEGVPIFTGKPDRIYQRGGDYLDINFKTGRKESEESHLNLQLRSEVVLIYHNFKPERVFAAIVEPLVSNKPEIVCYEKADLLTAEAEILKIVDRTNYETTRTAGAWCIHCPARAFCPESHALAVREPLYVYTPDLPKGAEAASLLEKVDSAYAILDAIWKHYQDLVRREFAAVPGWHISKGAEVRAIDPGAAILIEPAAKDLVKETIAIGKLEELMSKIWGLTGVAFDKKFAAVFKDAIKVKTTKGSLEKIPKRLLK